MLGKKPGPPVPPRPSAVAVALARSNRGGSPNGGRTIVYKSPSFESKPTKNQPLNHVKSDNKVNGATCDKGNDDPPNEGHIQSVVKAEIYIDRENAENCSPVPKPRTNHQKLKGGAKVVENDGPPPSLPTTLPPPLIKPSVSTSSVIIGTPVATAATTAGVGEIANNSQNALDVNMESKNNKKNQNYTNMNNNTLPKFGLTDEKADHENRCGGNNNNNNNKLMTEILIEKSNKNFRMPLIETKNLTAFKKFASENNLHSPVATRKVLPSRPEPEGGEREHLYPHGVDSVDPTNGGKRVAFHEMLISELTEMRNKEPPLGPPKLPRHESEKNLCDISPNGTHRARIRTSDWIEVSDSGQPEVFTSCQISLEDSGMEDEEKLDDASSGVGDSWDSAKDAEER
jgi:hypothetical protein